MAAPSVTMIVATPAVSASSRLQHEATSWISRDGLRSLFPDLIRVYDDAGNVTETHEQAVDFKE